MHIQNFRTIEYETIHFGKNKTVFVGKNGSGKTNILKALEKLFNSKKIKEKDFKNKKKTLILEAQIKYKEQNIDLIIEANLDKSGEVIVKKVNKSEEVKDLIKKINLIYIPSDRKINKDNKENGYLKLIDLILSNKEKKDEKYLKMKENIEFLNTKTGRKKTTLLISLLRLYLYSLQNTKNEEFKIFIIDQPENFLHPHATKMIDTIISQIGEHENTQVFYSTHSPDLVSNFRKGKYEISDIVFVKYEENKTITKTIDNSYGRFNKIMINLIFKNSDIFFSDKVILVEGETEKISIPNIYENTDWEKYSHINEKNLGAEARENYFNLDYKNISVIDVGGKGALYDWFIFASELFGKENVVAVIDRDENFYVDRDMIHKTIRQVYKVGQVFENDFKKYNWIVLDGEFENYYKVDVLRNYIVDVLENRAKNTFGEKLDPVKLMQSINKLDAKLLKLKHAKKISSVYESIFSSYFRKYSKPTIAFNLSTWLTQNNGFDERLLKIFSSIVEKFED